MTTVIMSELKYLLLYLCWYNDRAKLGTDKLTEKVIKDDNVLCVLP